jgi:hypothetical protein
MVFAVFGAAAALAGCENVLWNDLAVQGTWKKDSEVMFVNKTMVLEIDRDGIRWKEEGAEEWEAELPCTASFCVLYIKFPGKTVRGSYVWALNYMVLRGFTWDDRLVWLNGAWKK